MDEKLIYMVLRMIKDRAEYWNTKGSNRDVACGFERSAELLEYAIANEAELLRELDHFKSNTDAGVDK